MSTPAPAINIFRREAKYEVVPAGKEIFRQGDEGSVMFAVKSGDVDLLVDGELVESVAEGGIFGEMALIDHQPRSGTARARTDAQIVPIDEKRFTYLVMQTPMFALHVMRTMAFRLRKTNEGLSSRS